MVTSGRVEQRAQLRGVKIFPQPVLDKAQLRYKLSDSRPVSITIQNIRGKRVKSFSWSGQRSGENSHQMNLSGLANGSYFYHFKAGDFQQRGKLIVIGK